HRDDGAAGQDVLFAVGCAVPAGVADFFDARHFADVEQVAFVVRFEHGPVDGSGFGHRVAQVKADVRVYGNAVARLVRPEEVGHDLIGGGAVVVVGIDDGKGRFDGVACGEYGLPGAPRLLAAFRYGEAVRQVIHFLIDERDRQAIFPTWKNRIFQCGQKLPPDDEHGPVEPCAL